MGFKDIAKRVGNALTPTTLQSDNLLRGTEERAIEKAPFTFTFNGVLQSLFGANAQPDREELFSGEFDSNAREIYKSNGVAFSVMRLRMAVFSDAEFVFKRKTRGRRRAPRPGDMFGTSALDVLENPWPGGTSRDLLSRMIQDADIAGNSFVVRESGHLQRLRPDWVTIVYGSRLDADNARYMPDAEVIGYIYEPNTGGHSITKIYLPEEVAHWAPLPDPEMNGLGMSWLQPILRELGSDVSMQEHVRAFFKNGANPGQVLTFDPTVDEEKASRFLEQFRQTHSGVVNAYKTLILGGGASLATKMASELKDLEVGSLNAAHETRIAMAGGVNPMLLGMEIALRHGSVSGGPFARRLFADGVMRPLWASAVESLEKLVNVPGDAKLWFNDRHISFLREDQVDASKILQTQAITTRQLIDAGFTPESVTEAVNAEDMTALQHTGRFSVQLRPPLTGEESEMDQAKVTSISSQAIEHLVNAGYTPESVVQAIVSEDMSLLEHSGMTPLDAGNQPPNGGEGNESDESEENESGQTGSEEEQDNDE